MKLLVVLLCCTVFVSCIKQTEVSNNEGLLAKQSEQMQLAIESDSMPQNIPLEDLSLKGLIGKWIQVDFTGNIDPSNNSLQISDLYNVSFIYQGHERKCKLNNEDEQFILLSDEGDKYFISRLRSMYPKVHNGIGITLVVDNIDDISLGFFQKEEVMLIFENKN